MNANAPKGTGKKAPRGGRIKGLTSDYTIDVRSDNFKTPKIISEASLDVEEDSHGNLNCVQLCWRDMNDQHVLIMHGPNLHERVSPILDKLAKQKIAMLVWDQKMESKYYPASLLVDMQRSGWLTAEKAGQLSLKAIAH